MHCTVNGKDRSVYCREPDGAQLNNDHLPLPVLSATLLESSSGGTTTEPVNGQVHLRVTECESVCVMRCVCV